MYINLKKDFAKEDIINYYVKNLHKKGFPHKKWI